LPLTLSSGKQADDLIFRMTPAAIITGHVRDENGRSSSLGASNGSAELFRAGKTHSHAASTSTTNDLGEIPAIQSSYRKYLLSAGYEMSQSMGMAMAIAMGSREKREG